MVDTYRSVAEILALTADNASGNISAQDIRDFFLSGRPGFGSLYYTTPVETVIPGVNDWIKTAGVTTANNLLNVDMPESNRLRYIGRPTTHAHIAASISVTEAANNKTFEFAVAKNGVILDHSILSRKMGTGTDVAAFAMHADVMMETNDYLEFFVRNISDGTNITVVQGYLFFLGMMV